MPEEFKVVLSVEDGLQSAIIAVDDSEYKCTKYSPQYWAIEDNPNQPLLAFNKYEAAEGFALQHTQVLTYPPGATFEIWSISSEKSNLRSADFYMWHGDTPFPLGTLFCKKIKLIERLSVIDEDGEIKKGERKSDE